MEQNTHSHRHFVAFPFFVLVLVISCMFGTAKDVVSAQLTNETVTTEGTVVAVAPGIDALVYSGVGFAEAEFQGSALVRMTGLQQVSIGDVTLYGASGLLHLTHQNDVLTIAALTTPVVVLAEDSYIVVPAGTQWHASDYNPVDLQQAKQWFAAHKTAPLPQRFIERQLLNMQLLPPSDWSQLLPQEDASTWISSLPFMRYLLLPKSLEAAAQDKIEQQHYGIYKAVQQADASALEMALEAADVQPPALALLLETVPHESVTALSLLEHIVTDSEPLWLLYSVHPLWRDASWTFENSTATPEALAARIVSLPLSDTTLEAVSVLAEQRWQQAVELFSRSVADPVPFLEQLITLVGDNAIRLDTAGYPQRARQWIAALTTMVDSLPINLPTASLEKVQYLQNYGVVDTSTLITLPPEAEVQTSDIVEVAETPPVEEAYTPDVVEQRTLSVLQDMGAIFTVETVISAIAPNTAKVQGVLFSVPSGDYLFDFSYNVVTGEIANIIRNTQAYPYALDIAAFKKWVQE